MEQEGCVPEKKITVPLPNSTKADAVEVGVTESVERWTDVKLDDGSSLRLKAVVLTAVRLEDQYDPEGNPQYLVKVNQVMTVVSAPDHLRKGGGDCPKGVQ
jgi:hypothetical protein